jgi:signal transduction histidine kinase
MMRLDISPFRTSIFRLTTLYVCLFSLSVGVLFTIVGYVTRRSMHAQISATVQREASALAEYDAEQGSELATDLITQRLATGTFSYFLLQDAKGRLVAGNIGPVGRAPGLRDLTIYRKRDPRRPESGEENEPHQAIGYGIELADGGFVLVANDAERIVQVESAIETAFVVAGSVSLLLAILGGIALSVSFLRRVEMINRTSHDIMSGRFNARIPVLNRNDELDRLAINLNAMFDRIQNLMESLKQISSDVAHDLRTPLSRLRQTLELARMSAKTVEEFRAATDAAVGEADDILETFTALLRIAQIESGLRRKGFARVDLSAVFVLMADTYGLVAEDSGHELSADIEPGIEILGDRELLLQLGSNLVENALRHTPKGSKIEIELHRNAEGAIAVIADNGPGIPTAERSKVFHRFYRLESSRTTPGNGLGLALAAAIAELHDAHITMADNCPGLRLSLQFAPVRT